MDTHVGRESAVVNRIIRHLVIRGAWCVKTTGVGKVGCPDIVACYRGYFIGIEVKREDNGAYGVTKKQQFEIDKIRLAGGVSLATSKVSDVNEQLDLIDAILRLRLS